MTSTVKGLLRRMLGVGKSSEKAFHAEFYHRHNQRRLEHLASLGLDVAGATVLEVGAGIGDHTSFFLDRGCAVTTSDGRPENVRRLRERHPRSTAIVLDLDAPPGEFRETFEIVYCYGLLYHLTEPSRAMDFMARCCSRLLLLETCVSFGGELSVNSCPEDSLDPTQAVSGTGCRPTRRWIFGELKSRFPFVYMPATQPNHEEFPLDWTAPPPGEGVFSRSVFIASRVPVDNPLLTESVPERQRRAP